MGRWRAPPPESSPYITPAGFEALQKELDDIWLRRRDVVKALAAAAAEGDRSENAEYIYRKKELGGLDYRIRYLQKRLPVLNIVRQAPKGDKVFFGTSQAVLMEVEVRRRKKDGGLDVGMPKMLFSYREDDSVFRGRNGFYDVVGDGERFLLSQGPEREQDQGLIMLVVPWSAEIEEENPGPQTRGAG